MKKFSSYETEVANIDPTDLEVYAVPANKIVADWDDIELFLKRGSEHWEEYYTLEWIFESLVSGKMMVWWLADDGGRFMLGLTEILDYPVRSVLRILWIGGSNLRYSLPALTYADIIAVRLKCSRIEVIGRKGFRKVLGSFGYEQKAVLYVKDLDDMKEH